jgi:hypothetical protein
VPKFCAHLLLPLILAVQGCGASQEQRSYIGLRYAALPANLVDEGGALIGQVEDTQYALAEVGHGRVRMLWLERLTNGTGRRPSFEVLAVLIVPHLEGRDMLQYGEHTCSSNDALDTEIVAITEQNDESQRYNTRVRHAWRANRQNRRFESTGTLGIECENPSYGLP